MLNLLIFDPSVAIGFVFILAVAVRWFLVPGDARRSEYMLLIGIFGVIADPLAQAVANSLSGLRPMKMDLYAYAMDRYLGQPAFVLGRIVAPHIWAEVLLNVAYGLLPIAVVFVLTWHILRRSADVRSMVWAFVLNLVIAPVFYLLIPVCGPRFAFPAFPVEPGWVLPHMLQIQAAPNGVPSVHLSTALLVAWFSRKSRPGLAVACVYLLLIVVATLASGQHYAVDLLAAVPYAATMLWLAKNEAVSLQGGERESGGSDGIRDLSAGELRVERKSLAAHGAQSRLGKPCSRVFHFFSRNRRFAYVPC